MQSTLWAIALSKRTRKTCEKALQLWGRKDALEYMGGYADKGSIQVHCIRKENIEHVTRAIRLYRIMLLNKRIADRALREIKRKSEEVDWNG